MFSVFDTVVMNSREVRRLIEHYFHCRFQNQVRVDFLNNRHAVTMSLSTLKRLLHDYGLGRRGMLLAITKLRKLCKVKYLAPANFEVTVALAKIESSHLRAKRKGCQYSLRAKSS